MRRLLNAAITTAILTAMTSIAIAQEIETLTEDGVISGTMDIDFKTRTNKDSSGDLKDGSPAKGAQDKYNFTLSVAKTTEFSGSIVRQPNLYTKTMHKNVQGAAVRFDSTVSVLNPKDMKQKKAVGKWVGVVPIDTASGAYELNGGAKDPSPLRFVIDSAGSAGGFTDNFGGRLIGKTEKKENLAEYHYKRLIGDKTVNVVVKKVDPMRFDNIELGKGPVPIYPRTVVNGRLDYDYEVGNYMSDGIRFKYSLNGKDFEDVVTGSIRWVPDASRKTNGKGHYEFNLRFNEDKNKPAAGESAAFSKMSDEEAFFAVDNSVPCLTGNIDYVDTGDVESPSSSKVTFNLRANKLTKQQVMNFFKLWMICVGPTNDE